MITVNAQELFDVLNKPANIKAVNNSFKHIKPFAKDELEVFLEGKPGKNIDDDSWYTRSYQVKQVLSAIGANLVDKGKADAETFKTYKNIWKIEIDSKCPCCKRKYKNKLMFQTPSCKSAKCQLQHMRESI